MSKSLALGKMVECEIHMGTDPARAVAMRGRGRKTALTMCLSTGKSPESDSPHLKATNRTKSLSMFPIRSGTSIYNFRETGMAET